MTVHQSFRSWRPSGLFGVAILLVLWVDVANAQNDEKGWVHEGLWEEDNDEMQIADSKTEGITMWEVVLVTLVVFVVYGVFFRSSPSRRGGTPLDHRDARLRRLEQSSLGGTKLGSAPTVHRDAPSKPRGTGKENARNGVPSKRHLELNSSAATKETKKFAVFQPRQDRLKAKKEEGDSPASPSPSSPPPPSSDRYAAVSTSLRQDTSKQQLSPARRAVRLFSRSLEEVFFADFKADIRPLVADVSAMSSADESREAWQALRSHMSKVLVEQQAAVPSPSFPMAYSRDDDEALSNAQRHYNRIQMILRHQVPKVEVLLSTKSRGKDDNVNDFLELSEALHTLQRHVITCIGSLLLQDVAKLTEERGIDDEEEDEEDLFAGELVESASEESKSPTKLFDAMIASLASSQMDHEFLAALETHLREKKVHLVTILTTDLFRRLDQAMKIPRGNRNLPFLATILHHRQQRQQGYTTASLSNSSASLLHGIHAVTALLSLPTPIDKLVGQAVHQLLVRENDSRTKRKRTAEGREVERHATLRPLLCAAGASLPEAGMEVKVTASHFIHPYHALWLAPLEELSEFPLAYFHRGAYKSNGQKLMDRVKEQTRSLMKAARLAFRLALSKAMKVPGARDDVFVWLSANVIANQTLAHLFINESLSADGIAGLAASRPFLYGLASSLLSLCAHDLERQLEKMGMNAFDVEYLRFEEQPVTNESATAPPFVGARRIGLEAGERRMISVDRGGKSASSSPHQQDGSAPSFSGATELFFLTAGVVRIAVHPIMDAENAFHQSYSSFVTDMEKVAASHANASVPPSLRNQSGPPAAAMLGWNTALLEPEFTAAMTVFALTQLRWVQLVASKEMDSKDDQSSSLLALIPEWMCKQPAHWLSHIATYQRNVLKPRQAEAIMECVTEVLLVAGRKSSERSSHDSIFSVAVLAALMRVAFAFVQAGVNQARTRELSKQLRRTRGQAAADAIYEQVVSEDAGDLDIYTSFDHNDLGVTVFTNAKVTSGLCPALMFAYEAFDAAVGVDVDKEQNFNKNGLRRQASELFLRLWSHPNGRCRQSVLELPPQTVAQFCASISGNISVHLDFAWQELSDACRSRKANAREGTQARLYSRHQERHENQRVERGLGFLRSARQELIVLYHLSLQPVVAASFGAEGCERMARKVAAMVHHLFNEFTDSKGNTKEELDFRLSASAKTSSQLLEALRNDTLSQGEIKKEALDLLKARDFAQKNIGLDLPSLCHLFLALAARWHLAGLPEDGSSRVSSVLDAFGNMEECEVDHLRCIAHRYVFSDDAVSVEASQASSNIPSVLERDGYVELHQGSQNSPSSVDSRRNRINAQAAHLSRDQVCRLCPDGDIEIFLCDLQELKMKKKAEADALIDPNINLEEVQKRLLTLGLSMTEEEYGERLGLWVISSESFLTPGSTKDFAHHFNATARSSSDIASGKVLQREARRCQRMLPTPHPNGCGFVCYCEERMDLCRGVVTGSVDTPYSLGLFVFDVFYPSFYPHIAPLVSFETTGGGQMRFSPNLYVDGKVCISLLGTHTGTHESEKWSPEHSSLAQLLMSIQTQILVDEPYFTEPGYEAQRNTAAGQEASRLYNMKIRLGTLRYAMINHLKCPPKGFEVIVQRHFSMCRRRVLAQARRWTMEARGTDAFKRFDRAYKELVMLLDANEKKQVISGDDHDSDDKKKSADGEEEEEFHGGLPPLPQDVQALSTLDPVFVAQMSTGAKKLQEAVHEKKRASTSNTADGADVNNPWANPSDEKESNADDDFDDLYD